MSSPRKAMVILISALALLMPTSASAGQPDTVDPALMQPALNPTFAPWRLLANRHRHRLRWSAPAHVGCARERARLRRPPGLLDRQRRANAAPLR